MSLAQPAPRQLPQSRLGPADAEHGVDPDARDRLDRAVAGDIAHEDEVGFAEALGECVDASREVAGWTVAHVLDRVDAEAVKVRVGHPEPVHFHQGPQCRRGREHPRDRVVQESDP